MNNIAIITGGGTGIGRALAVELAKNRNISVLICGRREENLRETAMQAPDRINYLSTDVSTEQGRIKISENIHADTMVDHLVHNAAVLNPIKPLTDVSLDEWRQHQAINVEGPLFLTKLLLQKLHNGRVLHISSGAAHNAYEGWGAYCTSKAALHMLYMVLREELEKFNIRVGSVRPGVVETDMQTQIRSTTKENFPHIQKFIDLKKNDALAKPEQTAKFIADLLLNTTNEKYISREWDFRQHSIEVS